MGDAIVYWLAYGLSGRDEGTDVVLHLSQVSTQVEVVANADQLQSDSTTVESAVGADVIGSVPNANQNPLYYASLLAGVVGRAELSDTTAFQSFGIGYDGRRWQSAINVGGASAFTAAVERATVLEELPAEPVTGGVTLVGTGSAVPSL